MNMVKPIAYWIAALALCGSGVVVPAGATTIGPTIAAGGSHSCAVVDGGVRCWGSNDDGQLGNPAFGDVDAATDVAGLRPNTNAGVTAVAAGSYHTCAIVNGGVQCWGDNGHGQLGLGDTLDRSIPTTIPNLTGVTAIAAGHGHTCAISNGSVQCWGYNFNGQVGDGTQMNALSPKTVIGSDVTAIAAGDYHTCAVVIIGKVQCWGSNDSGQLGVGDTPPAGTCSSATQCDSPTTVSGLADAKYIAAGDYHTCVTTFTGGVRCWGYNGYGQLGLNNRTSSSSPQPILSLVAGATTISAGEDFTCAVVNSAVQCWGAGDLGQQGNDQWASDSLTPHIVLDTADSGTTEVSAGGGHACARYNNQLVCWGDNGHGMLGTGDDGRALTPQAVSGLSGGQQIAAGDTHTCAVVNGSAQCWGNNGFAQVGDGTTVDALGPKTVIASGVTAIATGSYHTCAVVNGGVWCWGQNYSGQLGLGNTPPCSGLCSSPTPVGLTGVTAIAAGDRHTCAIVNGSVLCWGSNSDGQLGVGTPPASCDQYQCNSPVQVPGLTGVTAITAGVYHTCARLNTGSVLCWGSNSDGQLGVGSTPPPTTCSNSSQCESPTIVPIFNLDGVTAIAAGAYHTCALLGDGSVQCWGYNYYGQLGLGDNSHRFSPTLIPNLTGITAIAAGTYHTCVITNFFGAVACWGKGSDGQLGNGWLDDWWTPHAVGLIGATSISAGSYHTCAVLADGTARCWGVQLYGRLGNYVSGLLTTPKAVIDNDVLFRSRFEIKP